MTTRHARRFSVPFAASTLALTFAAGCWTRSLPTIDLDAGGSGTGAAYGTTGSGGFIGMTGTGGVTYVPVDSTKLDLLFMVDNSSSMKPLQAKMRAQIPAFVSTLRSATTGALPNLHVAVVSSSFGGGAWGNVNQCHSAAADPATTGDDQGRFRQGRGQPGAGSCTMLHMGAKFLDTGDGSAATANFDGDLGTALGCISDLGDNGCGFEMPFASVNYALYKGLLPDDPDNGGFLRFDAKLAVVLLTNEDDCSVRGDSLLLDPAVNSVKDPTGLGALGSYRCNEFGHLCSGVAPPHGYNFSTMQYDLPAAGVTLNNCVSAEDIGKTDGALTDPNGSPDPTMGHLWPTVAEFDVRMYKANPDDVFVAAIAGPTTGPGGESLYHVSPQSDAAAGGEIVPVVDHSCTQMTADPSQQEYADPAVRIKQWVDSFGTNGIFYPICASDLSAAMTGVASAIHSHMVVP